MTKQIERCAWCMDFATTITTDASGTKRSSCNVHRGASWDPIARAASHELLVESNIPIPILTGNATPRIAALIDAERTMECYRELARAAIDWVMADRKADDAMAKLKTAERAIEASGANLADMGRMLEDDAANLRETSAKEERMHEALLEQCRRLVGRLER